MFLGTRAAPGQQERTLPLLHASADNGDEAHRASADGEAANIPDARPLSLRHPAPAAPVGRASAAPLPLDAAGDASSDDASPGFAQAAFAYAACEAAAAGGLQHGLHTVLRKLSDGELQRRLASNAAWLEQAFVTLEGISADKLQLQCACIAAIRAQYELSLWHGTAPHDERRLLQNCIDMERRMRLRVFPAAVVLRDLPYGDLMREIAYRAHTLYLLEGTGLRFIRHTWTDPQGVQHTALRFLTHARSLQGVALLPYVRAVHAEALAILFSTQSGICRKANWSLNALHAGEPVQAWQDKPVHVDANSLTASELGQLRAGKRPSEWCDAFWICRQEPANALMQRFLAAAIEAATNTPDAGLQVS